MSKPKRDHKQTYERLMRKAGESKLARARRSLARERKVRSRVTRQWEGSIDAAIERIERELGRLVAKYERTWRKDKRVLLKAEIAHLRNVRNRLTGKNRPPRKPPESGIAVPAVPPNGPLPKQGGAEAPLDFDA